MSHNTELCELAGCIYYYCTLLPG